MNWYLQVLQNYCGFSGRARRKEYWMFVLVNLIVSFVLGLVDGFLGIQILTSLYNLAILIPNFALQFRRLHDIDRSAWWLLLAFVPLVGAIVLLIFTLLPGTVGENKYGADPKEAE